MQRVETFSLSLWERAGVRGRKLFRSTTLKDFVDYPRIVSMSRTAVKKARFLRRNKTWAEKLVWKWLRDRRFSEIKFRRQHPFGPYILDILDFYCLEVRL